jgi:TFIIF-interacting CTD phosphatase-like protein
VLQKEGISLPPLPVDPNAHRPPLTLFLELDDIFLHTFLVDENFGHMANPNSKTPEHEFFIQEVQQPVLVYERDHMHEFLDFLKRNKPNLEPIIYTTGEQVYSQKLLKIIDPDKQIFDHVFYRNACYLFEHREEDITIFVKDIARFKTRDIKRCVLMDPRPLSFMMTPENGMPVIPYIAEFDSQTEFNEKEDYLLTLMEEIEELMKMDDVRPYLDSTYKLR